MHLKNLLPPMGCDTLVALAPATADGSVIFAKNSDRPADESQPLFQAPRLRHRRGTLLKCQYIEVPQAERSLGIIGSRPHWLWGFEHGVNDCGVAIGNEAVFTKEDLPEIGLLGMDLVRIGLERGTSARQALEVIVEFLERYGQGGAAYEHLNWGYSNSFIVADAAEAYVLETAARHFAIKQVNQIGSISNHIAIGKDWQKISDNAESDARNKGWWPDQKRLNFSAAYRSMDIAPPQISEERLRQSGSFLEEYFGKITPEAMMRILRDHYDSETVFTPGCDPGDGKCYSICMHADPVGTTAASVVAHIRKAYPFVTYWASLGNPCCGVFMPLYLQAEIPSALALAGPEFSEDSIWWLFKRLDEHVAVDYAGRTPAVQRVWTELEQEFAARAQEKEAEAANLHKQGKPKEAAAVLKKFMEVNLQSILPKAKALLTS